MDLKHSKNILKVATEYLVLSIVVIAILLWTIIKRLLSITRTNLKKLDGEIVVITGGGSGIGRLVALRLIRLNAIVVIIDINQKGINETVEMCKGLGGKAYGYYCDLSKRKDVYEIATQISEEIGTVTILVNNAGIVSGGLFLDTPDTLIEKTMEVNIMAHFWTTKAFLPAMLKKNHGHIVNIASMAGIVGLHKLVDYCSSKFAAVGFHLALRLELEQLGKHGIATSVICPYFIQETGMFNDVSTQFLPLLKSNEVADRIILAIRRNDNMVFMPGYFRILIMWRDVVPWEFLSIFLRNLVPDATPTHTNLNSSPKAINNPKTNSDDSKQQLITKSTDILLQLNNQNSLRQRLSSEAEL